MQYSRFYKNGQQIILRALGVPVEAGRMESLTTYLQDNSSDQFDLLLPYCSPQGESYPFTPQMPFELLSDSMGLGLRMTGAFKEQVGNDLIRLAVNGDYQVFQRRHYRRLDFIAGLRYTRGRGTLRSFREQWERNLQILSKGTEGVRLDRFPRAKVNLSAGGIRFSLKAPVEMADLCLLLLEVDNLPPICALAEVIWIQERIVEGRQVAGLRFIHILEADQKRIDDYIRQHAPTLEGKPDKRGDY
jgi:c-di-GMP-binding flagellar brake protein YcgR